MPLTEDSGQADNPTPTTRDIVLSALAALPTGTPEGIEGITENAIEPTAVPDTRPPSYIGYTVQEGDTAGGLAAAYDISLSSLLWSNPGLGDADDLSPGDELRIPLTDGIVYDVQPGDTLSDIAARFQVDVQAIIDVWDNNLTAADALSENQTIFIPGGSVPVPTATPTPEPAPTRTPTPERVATPPAPPPSGDGADIVAEAETRLGMPYVSGGVGPEGFDCSGLVYWVFTQLGYSAPRTVADQYYWSTPIDRSELEPGDLVFFSDTYSSADWLTHVGIYIGGGMFIHAADYDEGVRETSLSEAYWDQHYAAAGRPPS
jgi:peptidoglycan endopeptidase LytE